MGQALPTVLPPLGSVLPGCLGLSQMSSGGPPAHPPRGLATRPQVLLQGAVSRGRLPPKNITCLQLGAVDSSFLSSCFLHLPFAGKSRSQHVNIK